MLINNRYEINAAKDFIDHGGFGRVYKAIDNNTNITVALKQFSVNHDTERQTLKAEIQHAQSLSHPNIVKYLDYFETQSLDSLGQNKTEQWAVMEYIAGGNLATFIEQKSQEEKQGAADEIINGIINGLDYLHTRRWDIVKNDWVKTIHRDLKPANILLYIENGKITPKICDFGLSKEMLESQSNSQATSTAANNTIEYAAPELFNPKLRQDGVLQTNYDYWALGVIIYKYFTNKLPFGSRQEGTSPEQIMSAILEQKPNLKLLPEKWTTLVNNCLEKEASKRIIRGKNITQQINIKSYKKSIFIILCSMFIGIIILYFLYFYNKKRNEQIENHITLNNNNDIIIDSSNTNNFKESKDTIVFLKTPLKMENLEVEKSDISNTNKSKSHNENIIWDKKLDFFEGFAGVSKKDKWGFINTKGELMWGGLEWDQVWFFSNGFAEVAKDYKYGFINKNGELMWDGLKWDDAKYFKDGFAPVKIGVKWGYINTNGKLMWGGLEWDHALSFENGYAVVKKENSIYIIDKFGLVECVRNCP
jgi:serine/threonine protein kinase